MSILSKVFGRFGRSNPPAPDGPADSDPVDDPSRIKVFDSYGREIFISKQRWKESVLRDNLEKQRNDPEQLYGMLVGALKDGFATDVIDYAEHLWRTDTTPSRGAAVLGISYMEAGRLDDAERVLSGYLAEHAADGVVLTNLAKVHSRKGDAARAEALLWDALQSDPNQQNGLDWYAAIQRERGGETAASDAYRRVAALPGSWRAQLWLARTALEKRELETARSQYDEALARAGRVAPADLLMQMSGDLGNNGYLAEIVSLVEPHFDASAHGLPVGNNLIKANLDLGRVPEARLIVDRLYAQNRHDWRETLTIWDTEIAKAAIAARAPADSETLSIILLSIEGPLWTRDGSPFVQLLPPKPDSQPLVAVFGSTVVGLRSDGKPRTQLSDAPGRLSRAIALVLAERIHLSTDAAGVALIPWAQKQGFALFTRPYSDEGLCELISTCAVDPELVVAVDIDAAQPQWKVQLRLLRPRDAECVDRTQVEAIPENPGPSIGRLAVRLTALLQRHARMAESEPPAWYQLPSGSDSSDYLLRLEQQLAVLAEGLDSLEGGGLSGEREIVDGILHLCVRLPSNPLVRILLAQTLRLMGKVRPEVVSLSKERVALLQREHPLPEETGRLIEAVLLPRR